jgi:hypothetical protein
LLNNYYESKLSRYKYPVAYEFARIKSYENKDKIMTTIAIASDHAGWQVKEKVKKYLVSLKYTVKDLGLIPRIPWTILISARLSPSQFPRVMPPVMPQADSPWRTDSPWRINSAGVS